VRALAATDFADGRRSHLGFQLSEVLQLLAAYAADPVCSAAAAQVISELARSQRDDGGFGYDRGELYTLCVATTGVVLALLDARDAGIDVPRDCVARAVAYLEACQGEGGGSPAAFATPEPAFRGMRRRNKEIGQRGDPVRARTASRRTA
jgi:uncharacterized protein YfaS (alpha-2-macroglobulin family)